MNYVSNFELHDNKPVGRQNIARWQNQSLGDKQELRVFR